MSAARALGRSGTAWFKSTAVWLVIAILALAALTYLSWPDTAYETYDPKSPAPSGTKALAEVLKDEGVDITLVHFPDEIPDSTAGSTVAIIGSTYLTDDQFVEAIDKARDADRIVLVDIDEWILQEIDLSFTVDYSRVDYSRPSPETNADTVPEENARELSVKDNPCSDIFGKAREISNSSWFYEPTAEVTDYRMCFTDDIGGYIIALAPRDNLPQTVLFEVGDIFTNESITDYDNAAAALTLLGSNEKLIWYFPQPDINFTIDPTEGTYWVFFPDWFFPASYLLLFITLAVMVWKGRRFGRLATERLPITIKSTETTRSLGRLYERSSDTGVTLTHLQEDTRRRLIRLLNLPPTTSTDIVVTAIANRTERDPDQVRHLLYGSLGGPESHMLGLANELAALIQEVDHG